jgi:hypothetical protein
MQNKAGLFVLDSGRMVELEACRQCNVPHYREDFDFTPAEKREIADYMIGAWARWAGIPDPLFALAKLLVESERTSVSDNRLDELQEAESAAKQVLGWDDEPFDLLGWKHRPNAPVFED